MSDEHSRTVRAIRSLLLRLAANAHRELLEVGGEDRAELGEAGGPRPTPGDTASRPASAAEKARAHAAWAEAYHLAALELGEADALRMHARQAAHYCFLRILLRRLLEHEGVEAGDVADTTLEGYCRRFFSGPVFGWFRVSSALAVQVEAAVGALAPSWTDSDLPGQTYESCADRIGRSRLGYFLTRPEVAEYVLDQAGYLGTDIAERRLLDPACGSGSFLLHAAIRLRRAIVERLAVDDQGKLAQPDALAVAREFLERSQSNLVGFDLDPYACFLAEVNLFIRTLHDWVCVVRQGAVVEPPHFAVHNLNSLDLPLEATPGVGTSTRVAVSPGSFDYVVSNPPFVNRGVVAGAPSYGDIPFYRDVLGGDQNTYLLFLRLAAHLVSSNGVVAYVVPLNLLGDRSSQRAREMFADGSWRVVSLTRFYSRTQLFPGVLQGVCVVCFQRRDSGAEQTVEVRAGYTPAEARQRALGLPRAMITDNTPAVVAVDWCRSWLVTGQREAYDIWTHVRNLTERAGQPRTVAGLIAGRLQARKGDSNSTYLRALESSRGTIPLVRAAQVIDYGGWQASAYLDPEAPLPGPGSRYYRYRRDIASARQAVATLASLPGRQTVVLLKEIAGLEMRRPVRGTVVERGPAAPLVVDDTLVVFSTLRSDDAVLAYALFGLLTSALSNYLFGLFATNPHVSLSQLLRLPLPPDDGPTLARLALLAKDAVECRHAAGVGPVDDAVATRLRICTAATDQLVFDWYRIANPRWQQVIMAGMPWAQGRRQRGSRKDRTATLPSV